MSDIDDLLADINTEQREFAQMIWPPASQGAIERLRRFARDELRTDLPEGYVTLLGRNDGLDFNGHVIYGATEHREPFPSGFVEANERLGGPTSQARLLRQCRRPALCAGPDEHGVGRAGPAVTGCHCRIP
jgi:hypothetical protein